MVTAHKAHDDLQTVDEWSRGPGQYCRFRRDAGLNHVDLFVWLTVDTSPQRPDNASANSTSSSPPVSSILNGSRFSCPLSHYSTYHLRSVVTIRPVMTAPENPPQSDQQTHIAIPEIARRQTMERVNDSKQRFSKSRNGMSVLSCFLQNKVTLRSSLRNI